jgi:hypothetical protein
MRQQHRQTYRHGFQSILVHTFPLGAAVLTVRFRLAPRAPASQGSGSDPTLTGGGTTWALQDLIHTYHRQR